jgi:CheY-like chemotaxis protein
MAMAASLPHIDLLFTDMVMPGMSGPELAERLTAVQSGVVTLFASGYSDEALAPVPAGESRAPYLTKPFTADGLLAHVRELLDARASDPGGPGRPVGAGARRPGSGAPRRPSA